MGIDELYDIADTSKINKFKRNLPTNKQEVVNMWKSLRGIVSDETVIENLPFDIDTETELAKIKEQDEENIMKFQSGITNNEKKVGNGNVEEDTRKAKELPQGLQEKATTND